MNYIAGGTKVLQSHGICYDEDLVVECDYQISAGYEAMMHLLDMEKEVDGVFAANDWIAAGAIQALHTRGKQIPEDVAVVGHNDYSVGAVLYPPLTTVRRPSKKMGEIAAELLLDRIKNPGAALKHTIITPTDLVVRKST